MIFRRQLVKWWIVASLLFCVFAAVGQEARKLTIDVTVNGIHSSKGEIVMSLFNKDDGFPNQEKALKVIYVKIDAGKAVGHFTELAPGEYAISVYHDENGNKKLDRHFWGIPKEGVGASNNAKGHFGPPKFRDARFTISTESKSISITLTYL